MHSGDNGPSAGAPDSKVEDPKGFLAASFCLTQTNLYLPWPRQSYIFHLKEGKEKLGRKLGSKEGRRKERGRKKGRKKEERR